MKNLRDYLHCCLQFKSDLYVTNHINICICIEEFKRRNQTFQAMKMFFERSKSVDISLKDEALDCRSYKIHKIRDGFCVK